MEKNITNNPDSNIQEIAMKIAKSASSLLDLSQKQLEELAKIVITNRLATELNNAASIANIDYVHEKSIFLTDCARNSIRTTRAHRFSLNRMEEYAKMVDTKVLILTPKVADDFIYHLKASARANMSTNRDITACSSFFSFLERRYKYITNHFRGTKARPSKRVNKAIVIPTIQEIITCIRVNYDQQTSLAISIMAYRGLRIGALPSLHIIGDNFTARSKNKEILGKFDDRIKNTITQPFINITTDALRKKIERHIAKLYKYKYIQHLYTCHSFRHYYAISEYQRHKDIYRLSKLLHHTSIQVTETYLKGLKEIDL